MSVFHRKLAINAKMPPPFEEEKESSLYLSAGGCEAAYFSVQKLLQALYPQQTIHWTMEPNFKEIDTYVIFYLCPYGVEELSLLIEGIHHAQQILEHKEFKSEAHVLMIFYRDLKVAFPERKLQREKVMSNMLTEDVLLREAPNDGERIRITHEFGTNNLQDSLQQLTGRHLHFEIMP